MKALREASEQGTLEVRSPHPAPCLEHRVVELVIHAAPVDGLTFWTHTDCLERSRVAMPGLRHVRIHLSPGD